METAFVGCNVLVVQANDFQWTYQPNTRDGNKLPKNRPSSIIIIEIITFFGKNIFPLEESAEIRHCIAAELTRMLKLT